MGLLVMWGCGRTATVTELDIVPEPVFMVQKEGGFTLHSTLKMSITGVGQNSPTLKCMMKTFRSAHLHPSLVPSSSASDIELVLNDTVNTELGAEGYLLEVRGDGIHLSANSEVGLLYGVQTLMLMLPPDVMKVSYSAVTLPECTILDHPRFEWRGLAVDDSAGVLGKKFVKRLVDVMSQYKLNRLQLASPCVTDTDERAELCEYAAARNVALMVVGMFMETVSSITILTPIILPVAVAFGIDPVHLGIIMVLNLMIGVISPPFGVVLFAITRIGEISFGRLVKALIPWFIILIVSLLIVSFIPQTCLWLPSTMYH